MGSWRVYAMLLAGILFAVSGEMALKHGMNKVGMFSLHPDELLSSLFRAFTNPFVLGGFLLVFLGSIFWLAVISRVPLSLAYPMLSLNYVIVVLASWPLLGERPTLPRLAGVSIIMLGVGVVSRG